MSSPITIYMPDDIHDCVEEITLPARRLYEITEFRCPLTRRLICRIAQQLPPDVPIYAMRCPRLGRDSNELSPDFLDSWEPKEHENAVLLIGNLDLAIFGKPYSTARGKQRLRTLAKLLQNNPNLSCFAFTTSAASLWTSLRMENRCSVYYGIATYRNDHAFSERHIVYVDEDGELSAGQTKEGCPNAQYWGTLLYLSRKYTKDMSLSKVIEEYPGELFTYVEAIADELNEQVGQPVVLYVKNINSLIARKLEKFQTSDSLKSMLLGESLTGKRLEEMELFALPQFMAVLTKKEKEELLKEPGSRELAARFASSSPCARDAFHKLLEELP